MSFRFVQNSATGASINTLAANGVFGRISFWMLDMWVTTIVDVPHIPESEGKPAYWGCFITPISVCYRIVLQHTSVEFCKKKSGSGQSVGRAKMMALHESERESTDAETNLVVTCCLCINHAKNSRRDLFIELNDCILFSAVALDAKMSKWLVGQCINKSIIALLYCFSQKLSPQKSIRLTVDVRNCSL